MQAPIPSPARSLLPVPTLVVLRHANRPRFVPEGTLLPCARHCPRRGRAAGRELRDAAIQRLDFIYDSDWAAEVYRAALSFVDSAGDLLGRLEARS